MKTYDQLSKQTRNSLEELYLGADVNLIKTALNMQKGVLEELKEYYGTEDINEIASKASRGVKPLPPTPKAEPAPTPPAKFKEGDAVSHTTASGVVRFGKVLNVIALPNGKGWRYYCAATDGYQNFLAEENSMTLSDAEPTPKEEPKPQPKVEPTPEPTPAPTPKEEPKSQPKVEPKKGEDTPMMKQFKDLKSKHPDALILFRCGDFYETYNEDADAASEILGITRTRRTGTNIRMAGFPYHALETYLPKLIRAGKRVAICDQIEDPKIKATKQVVKEIVSPQPKKEEPKTEPKAEEEPKTEPKAEPREKPKTLKEEALERITKFLCKMIELKDNYDEDVVLLFKNTRQNAYYTYGKDAQRVSNAMECAPLKKQMGVWYTGFETNVTGWEKALQDAGITFDIIEGILP